MLGPGPRVAYLAYRTGDVAARALPGRVAEPLASILGRIAPIVLPERRRMASRHQRRATPGAGADSQAVDAAVRGVFASYARYWLELFRLPGESRRSIEAQFTIEGFEHIEAGLSAGRGVVCALPHLGGWEWAGAWIAARGHTPLAVVEPVEPPELFEWFVRRRAALGMEVVALGEDAAPVLLKALRDNRIAVLVSDRDLTGDGVSVDFFGERTTLPAGPAMLALRSGAPLIPLAVYFRPRGGHHAVVRPPIPAERSGRLRDDIGRITQGLARVFEDLIRAAPEQWHLLQPNWPSDSDGAGEGSAAT